MFVVALCMDGLTGNFWETHFEAETNAIHSWGNVLVHIQMLRVQLSIVFLLRAPTALVLHPVTTNTY